MLYIESDFSLGLNLADAPEIEEDNYVDRKVDTDVLREILLPNGVTADKQQVAVVSGLGGIGKTQLAITFAKTTKDKFSAIFWLNATSKALLQQSILALTPRIFSEKSFENNGSGAENPEKVIVHFKEWLSRRQNSDWMLIFDNYDEPKSYNIKKFFPFKAHGSILITTRVSSLGFGKVLKLTKLTQEQGLQILAKRSNRLKTYEGRKSSLIW